MRYGPKRIAFALAAGIGAAASLAAPPDYTAQLKQVVAQIQRNQHPHAVKALDSMLKKFKEPWQVRELRLYRAECLLATGGASAASAEAAKVAAEAGGSKDLLSHAAMIQADALRAQKKFADAVAAYRKLAADFPKRTTRVGQALIKAGDCLCNDLKKIPDGLAAYAEAEKKAAAEPVQAAAALTRAAGAYEGLAKDPVKAAGCYFGLAERYPAVFDENTRATYYARAVDLYRAGKQLPQAHAVAAKAEKALTNVQHKTGFALRQADALVEMKKHAQARYECRRFICTYPLDANICQTMQARVVETYRAESKFPDTLGAARILFDAAGDEQQIRNAAQVVAQAFRTADGKLDRANAFLAFQQFGPAGADRKPNTPDDIKANPLAAARYPAADANADKLFTAAVAALPGNYDGYRAKAFLYLYWGKPTDAAKHFLLAFKACQDKQVPAAANELILIGLKAHTASFFGLDKYFEFISYGPKGKSGKENIPDPFRGLH